MSSHLALAVLAAHHLHPYLPSSPGSTVGGGAGLGIAFIAIIFYWLVGSAKIPPGK